MLAGEEGGAAQAELGVEARLELGYVGVEEDEGEEERDEGGWGPTKREGQHKWSQGSKLGFGGARA